MILAIVLLSGLCLFLVIMLCVMRSVISCREATIRYHAAESERYRVYGEQKLKQYHDAVDEHEATKAAVWRVLKDGAK